MFEEPEVEMKPMQLFISIFNAPKKAAESIKAKPNWLIPFLLSVIIATILNILVIDIAIQDRISIMEAIGKPVEQIEKIENASQGSVKYLQLIAIPFSILLIWVILSFFIWLGSNTVLGGEATFKQYYSLVAWTWLIQVAGSILKTGLILANGTPIGVSTGLALLMPTPELGDPGSIFYQVLAHCDFFTIWQLAIWVIGISIFNRFSTNKSTGLVIALFVSWIAISISLGSVFRGMM